MIDPQEATPLSGLTERGLGSNVTTHGVITETETGYLLVEVDSDYSGNRLPVSVRVDGIEQDVEEGAYALVRGRLSTTAQPVAYGTAVLRVRDINVFDPELDEHATETSQSKSHNMVLDILEEYSDPVPFRFVVETAVERGIDREATNTMLERMVQAGNLYSPETGRVGSV